MKRFVIAVLLAVSSVASAQDDGNLVSSLSRDSVLIGDQVKWSIRLSLEQGEDFFFEKPDEPVAQGVETIRPWSVDTLKSRRGKFEVEGNMILTSFDSGSYFLPPLIAMIQRAGGKVDTLYYNGPVLEVGTVPIDTATFKPYDIKGQIKYPLTFREVAPWTLLGIGIVAIIFAIVWIVTNKRRNRDIFGREKVVDPPHIVALRNLDSIRNKKLWQNNKQKQFYTEVTDTVRQYISGEYDIPAMEQTTAELFEGLKNCDIDERLLESIGELFATADYVKFARHSASDAENEEVIPIATKFVNTTYMQRLEREAAAAAASESAEKEK